MNRQFVSAVLALLFSEPAIMAQSVASEIMILPVPLGTTPGAFGSVWSNELWLHNGGATPVTVTGGPCRVDLQQSCSAVLGAGETKEFLPAPDPMPFSTISFNAGSKGIQFHLRTRDLSRSGESAGTEIPLARQSDLFLEAVHLLNVPNDSRFRVMLRLFLHPSVTQQTFSIRLFSLGGGSALATRQVTVQSPILPAIYAGLLAPSLAITDLMVGIPSTGGPLRVEIAPVNSPGKSYWALISVTNNETQQVTTITPR